MNDCSSLVLDIQILIGKSYLVGGAVYGVHFEHALVATKSSCRFRLAFHRNWLMNSISGRHMNQKHLNLVPVNKGVYADR
jgi:hypothetical protein